MIIIIKNTLVRNIKQLFLSEGTTIQSPGEGWSFFKINNFGRTLHEINNLLQGLFYINT